MGALPGRLAPGSAACRTSEPRRPEAQSTAGPSADAARHEQADEDDARSDRSLSPTEDGSNMTTGPTGHEDQQRRGHHNTTHQAPIVVSDVSERRTAAGLMGSGTNRSAAPTPPRHQHRRIFSDGQSMTPRLIFRRRLARPEPRRPTDTPRQPAQYSPRRATSSSSTVTDHDRQDEIPQPRSMTQRRDAANPSVASTSPSPTGHPASPSAGPGKIHASAVCMLPCASPEPASPAWRDGHPSQTRGVPTRQSGYPAAPCGARAVTSPRTGARSSTQNGPSTASGPRRSSLS